MQKIKITITGVAAELVLGNYMPTDPTIMKNWEDFYHYNDLIHCSQIMSEYITHISIEIDGKENFKGQIPASAFIKQKSYCPVMVERALYLRTECAENATYEAEFETENFDKSKLSFETQDYDHLFRVGKSFITNVIYNEKKIELNWIKGESAGNICVLCRYENGYLVPIFDAIKKIEAGSRLN